MQAGAVNIEMIIIGRFIGGIAVDMLTSAVPMYAGDLPEIKFRGILSGFLYRC